MLHLTYRPITCLVYNRVLARGVRGGCRGQCRTLSYHRPIRPEDDTLRDNSDPDCLLYVQKQANENGCSNKETT